ncbi:unnamed protein product [Caenorhabditis angaria]|uniref:Uncharacterized protein n=1 Tax=Caenorhabditis angaria TaxID=860376 RepID=A0A9P1ISB3_9PELO|nr:unnamed protein product [Caenorhabditis angaria]
MPEVPRKTMSFEEEDFYSESTEELFEIDEEEPDLLDSLLDKAFDGKNDEDSAIDTMKEEELMSGDEDQENLEISAEDEENWFNSKMFIRTQ